MAGISGLSAGVVLAGRYQLSKRLWHRSIGELWLASDTVRRRRVWIQISDTGGLENAVSALQRVRHPAISTVREAGQKRIAHEDRVVTDHDSHAHKLIHKSDTYIEFAVYDQDKGSSLTARLMKGALTSAELAGVALSVAEVFEQVHAAGLVHGWLHTDSIWLGGKGNVFVDLALGLAYEGDADSLAAEAASGFVAPERLAGDVRVTAEADVYALSWLLYVCVFGWEIVRRDLEQGRAEALAARVDGVGGHVAGDGVPHHEDGSVLEKTVTITALSAYELMLVRREIAIRRIVEFFGAGTELAVLFTNCLSGGGEGGETVARPTMTEVVAVLRGRQEEIAALPVPAVVAEAIAASAAFAYGAEAVADELAARVEDADTGAWTPAVSPNAGGRSKTAAAAVGGAVGGAALAGMISAEECEALRSDAVNQALADAEQRYTVQMEEAISVATAAAVAAALAEAESANADVDEEMVAAASAVAIAEALAAAEERHAAERENAVALALAEHQSSTAELTEAAIAAAVAQALAEVEAAHAQANEEAVAAASAVAVEAALSAASAQHSAELEEARARAVAELEERHRSELAQVRAEHGAATEAAAAAAVALALAELEERHAAELEAARAAGAEHVRAEHGMGGEAAEAGALDSAAVEAASVAAVELAVAELEERHRVVIAELEERHRAEIEELRASQQAEREGAIAAASAAAVALALAEAERTHEAAIAELAEQHQAELAETRTAVLAEAEEGSGAGGAALTAATAAAVAAALAEAEERHAAELAAARAQAGEAGTSGESSASSQSGTSSGSESVPAATAMPASPPPPNTPGTPPTPGLTPVPKQRPTWLVASGTAVLGLAVGIGIGYAIHGSKSCSTSNATVVPLGGDHSAGSTSSSGSNGAPVPGASGSSSAGSATGTAGATASSAGAAVPSAGASGSPSSGASSSAGTSTDTATSPAGATSGPSAGGSGSPSAGGASASPGAPVPSASASASTPSAPAGPSGPATPYPTSAQQAESQMTDIVNQQVTNSNAAGALTGAISSIKASQPGSGAYNQAIGKLNGLVTTELNQGQISSGTATALRQQVTYLLSFSGS